MVGSSVGCDFAECGVGAAVGIAGSSLGSEREIPDRGETSPSGMGICAPSGWSSVSAGAAGDACASAAGASGAGSGESSGGAGDTDKRGRCRGGAIS